MGDAGHSSLSRKRVVVTRAPGQAVDLLKALGRAGAIPVLLPVIRILPPDGFAALDETLRKLNRFDWVLFTSQNAVRAVQERLESAGDIPVGEGRLPLAGAVGEATASRAVRAGFAVGHVASRPSGVVLVEELHDELAHKRVLLPRSDRANPDVVDALEKAGASVTEVVAYRTVLEVAKDPGIVGEVMGADAVLLFSPSAVEGFDAVCGAGKLSEFSRKGIVLASGPVTLGALRAKGIASATAAAGPSVAGVIEALANSFASRERRVSSGGNEG